MERRRPAWDLGTRVVTSVPPILFTRPVQRRAPARILPQRPRRPVPQIRPRPAPAPVRPRRGPKPGLGHPESDEEALARFYRLVDRRPDGHWILDSYTRGREKYPGFRNELAHRWLWRQVRGPIPEDSQVRNECGRRDCVNLDHWRLDPRRERVVEHREGNKSGVVGVTWHPRKQLWAVRLRKRHVGYAATVAEGEAMLDDARDREERGGEGGESAERDMGVVT